MHALHQQKHSTEGLFQLQTLNDAALFMEKHFFQLQLHSNPHNPLNKQFIFMMRGLTLLENRRIRLKKILERTDLVKNDPNSEENWIHFNYQINNLEKEILYNISRGRFTQRALHLIKQNFTMINGLVKFKLQYYKNQMLDQNITCDEILEEDMELDIDLNDPKNYSFRLYLKNNKAGARVRRVFIESFGFDNIDLANDIFGSGKEKVAGKLRKKFSLKVGKNDNDKASQAEVGDQIDLLGTDSLGDATLAVQQFDLENTNHIENNGSHALQAEMTTHYHSPRSERMWGEAVQRTDAMGCKPTSVVELANQLFERISLNNNNVDNISTNGFPTSITSIDPKMTSKNIDDNIVLKDGNIQNHTNKPNKNLTKAERKKLQIKEKEERKALQIQAFKKKQEMKELNNQSKDYKLSKAISDMLDKLKIQLKIENNKTFPEERWDKVRLKATEMEQVFGSILDGEGSQEWFNWLKLEFG